MNLFKSFCLLSTFILLSTVSPGQSLVKNFSGDYKLAGADPLGNFYLVNNSQIIKTDSTGTVLFTYSDPESGLISYFDVSDPFRVLVYYKEYNQLRILDRTLSPLSEAVALDELNIFKPLGIAKSSLGGFWVIDGSASSLLFIDHKLSTVLEVKISGFDDGSADPWYPMFEWKKRLYVCIPGKEIWQFDLFGTRLRTIPSNAGNFTSYNGQLLLTGSGELQILSNMPGSIPEMLELDLPAWKELHISGNHAIVKQQSSWSLYRLKKTF